jgi:signal transduction histidine kinase
MPNSKTLMIVDDCAADRKIYRRYLVKDPSQSYQFVEAPNAESGLALYQRSPSDIVLLDFCLPDMSGLEFLERLQACQTTQPLPVIMLTGQGDEAIAVQAIKRGAQDYLVKGDLKPDILQLAVRSVLKHSDLQARLSRTRQRQQLIATTALQIRQSLDLDQILHTATVEAQKLLQCDRVVIYQFDHKQVGTIVAESVGAEWTQLLGKTIQDTYFQQGNAEFYHEEYERAIDDIYASDLSSCYIEMLGSFEVRAKLAVPIILSTEEKPYLWGLLIAHQCSSTRHWKRDEVELFKELSVQLAIAIQQSELLTQTQAALEREKELNIFKSQIISTVSHEYRTPLASILAAASTLKQHHHRLEEQKRDRFLELIEQKARQMSSLVDDMLLVQELGGNKATFKPLPLDLLQFFADLIEEQQAIAGTRYELVYRISGNPKGFWGDRALVRQISTNLLSNAIKYSPNGGAIELHLVGKESQVVFSIRDEGIGVAAEDQVHLFQCFSRGSNVDTIPGTGLGLAIAKACVDLHGGTIELESQLNQGTKVTVTLPKQAS